MSRNTRFRPRSITCASFTAARRRNFECASAVTQLEAVRAGVGLGVVHDFIARRFDDLVRVLPERRATRAYWIVTHEDTRGLGRVRAAHAHVVASVERDRGIFTGKSATDAVAPLAAR